jgi:hypothetical protein
VQVKTGTKYNAGSFKKQTKKTWVIRGVKIDVCLFNLQIYDPYEYNSQVPYIQSYKCIMSHLFSNYRRKVGMILTNDVVEQCSIDSYIEN